MSSVTGGVKKIVRGMIRTLLGLFVMLLLSLLYVYYPVVQNPESGYLTRKGHLTKSEITRQWQNEADIFTEVSLHSDSELVVQLLIRKPISHQKKLPVVVLMGGVNTGRDACKLIPDIRNSLCVSVSYPYQGDRELKKSRDILANLRDIQQAVKDTPPALLLTLDYILTLPYSDSRQVEMIGVSFGAFFISIPAALDQRVTRTWLVQGAAKPIDVIYFNLLKNDERVAMKQMDAHLLGYAMGAHHIAPEKWVGRIAPRPVIFINARTDETYPVESVAALHQAAGQSHEVIWAAEQHVTPGRTDIIDQLSEIVLKRIEADFTAMHE